MRYMDLEEPPPIAVTLTMTTLRVVAALVVIAQAWQKLSDVSRWHTELVQNGIPWPEIAAPLSVAAGLFVGAGLVLGWLTRVSALGALCGALFAVALRHGHGLYMPGSGFDPTLVLAVVQAAIALVFLTTGGGRMSADRVLLNRARRRAIQMDARWHRPPYVVAPGKS